jgi:hypothetical protein
VNSFAFAHWLSSKSTANQFSGIGVFSTRGFFVSRSIGPTIASHQLCLFELGQESAAVANAVISERHEQHPCNVILRRKGVF